MHSGGAVKAGGGPHCSLLLRLRPPPFGQGLNGRTPTFCEASSAMLLARMAGPAIRSSNGASIAAECATAASRWSCSAPACPRRPAVLARHLQVPVALALVELGEPNGEGDDA